MAFAPKGDVPLWRKVYDHAVNLAPGEVIGWDTFTALLGYDPEPPGANRSPIRTAAARLADEGVVTLVSVRGEGYRVTPLGEVPRGDGLTSEQRQMLTAMGAAWAAQSARLAAVEDALRSAGIDVPAT